MLLPLPPLRRRHRRRLPASSTPPAPPPPVDVTLVGLDHGTEFNWVIYWEFSGPLPDNLSLADVAGLTVATGSPAAIVERGDDWLNLLYHTDGAVGETWLVRPGGSPAFLPGQTGVVVEV